VTSMSVKPFDLGDEVLEALETSLSPERMSTYVKAAGGDREKAGAHGFQTGVVGRADVYSLGCNLRCRRRHDHKADPTHR
ncbi:hypothetical protein, partial [Candidatus Thiosymbion oneisti]|uniref:hypothetical protein n=1 Tax=Candidatus Thiosymbion oneisti TaxID=589554 RepID=UPI001AAD7618